MLNLISDTPGQLLFPRMGLLCVCVREHTASQSEAYEICNNLKSSTKSKVSIQLGYSKKIEQMAARLHCEVGCLWRKRKVQSNETNSRRSNVVTVQARQLHFAIFLTLKCALRWDEMISALILRHADGFCQVTPAMTGNTVHLQQIQHSGSDTFHLMLVSSSIQIEQKPSKLHSFPGFHPSLHNSSTHLIVNLSPL